jgi:hypothetical protein
MTNYELTTPAGMSYHSVQRRTWQAEQQQAWFSDDRRPSIVAAANAQANIECGFPGQFSAMGVFGASVRVLELYLRVAGLQVKPSNHAPITKSAETKEFQQAL